MQYYSAYDLTIASEYDLFGVRHSDPVGNPDVTIVKGDFGHPENVQYDEGRYSEASFDEALLSWEKVGTIRIRQGREIQVVPRQDINPDVLSLFITGAAMGIVLHQRGLLVLHASAVDVDGSAIAFIGFKGMGKSTTAAAFVGRGYLMISDDVVALDARYRVRPGSEVVKLWPTALKAALNDDPESIPRIYPTNEKRARIVDDKMAASSSQLKAIYVLDSGDTLRIEPIEPAGRFVEVVRHSYAPRFVGTPGTPPEHFQQCTQLVADIPMYRLRRVPDLEQLSDVVARVEDHVRQLDADSHV